MRPRRGISESAQHGPWPAPGPELSLLSRQSPSAAPALGHHECQTYRAGSESVRAGLGFGLPGPRTGHGHGSTRRQPPFPAAFGSCWCKNSPQIHTKIFPYASSPRFTRKMVDAFWNVMDSGDYNVYNVWTWDMRQLGVSSEALKD